MLRRLQPILLTALERSMRNYEAHRTCAGYRTTTDTASPSLTAITPPPPTNRRSAADQDSTTRKVYAIGIYQISTALSKSCIQQGLQIFSTLLKDVEWAIRAKKLVNLIDKLLAHYYKQLDVFLKQEAH